MTRPSAWILTGARVLDPATGTDEIADLRADADGVRRAGPGDDRGAARMDLRGRVVVPAFVELHAHLREPGGEASETIATGLAAARAGGYGTVLAMANTRPVNDAPEVTRFLLERAAAADTGVRLHPVTAATLGLEGREPAPWQAQMAAGCVAISDDGRPVADPVLLDRVLRGAQALGVPYLSHSECPGLFHGPIHDGDAARRFGVDGIPTACESDAVAREIAAAERIGAALHVCHVSTIASLDALRAGRARGVRCSAEAAPHHLLLTDAEFLRRGPDTSLKMNPPLRPAEHRDALRAAVRDGLVEAIATDHAPHSPESKSRPLASAPFGAIGMESAFAVLHEHLVRREGWPLGLLVERMTCGPARVGGLAAGRLFSGRAALTVLDPEAPWRVRSDRFRSLSRNCPFDGWEGVGRVVGTLLDATWTDSDAPGAP